MSYREWIDPNETTDFDDVACVAETGLAILCEVESEPFWIPKSVVDSRSEVTENGDRGTLIVRTWFAAKEGMI